MATPRKQITLALDTMGGDHAPLSVLEGADKALARHPNVRYQLYGTQHRLTAILEKLPRLKAVSEIIHTDIVIHNDEKPSIALRKSKDSSMGLAIRAVMEGKADGAVSAGNTGALMAISKFLLRTLEGIDRPAIASLFPTKDSECVILDLGANVGCDADNLFEFAVMGDAFARAVLGLKKPRIGLLNIGSEEAKGRDEVKTAAQLIRESSLAESFYGYVEGDTICEGIVDVIVTDGFSGNVALKTAEGTAKTLVHYLRQAFGSSPIAKLGYLLAKPALKTMFAHVDPRHHNGAMFLGLNGIVVKSHGGTDSVGFANAVGVAANLVAHNINDQIIEEMRTTHSNLLLEKEEG
jgi:glycerol-3-phosphate acyltransferase PlsX